jgi:hypothetical protein
MSKSYEIRSFRGGISDYEDKGITGSFKFGYNLDIRKLDDSLTAGQAFEEEGLVSSASPSASPSPSSSVSSSSSRSPSRSASPTPSPSASQSPSASGSRSPSTTASSSDSPSPSTSSELTTVFRDLIRFFVKATDGYTYGFGSTGYVYRRDADGFWMRVYKATSAIKGAGEKPSPSTTYLVFATDTELFKKELPGTSNWNDVITIASSASDTGASLKSADWHTMKQVNGAMMICNGSWLALVGYDDSYTNEALNLIPGNIAKTLVERNGRTIVGTARLSDPNRSINGAIDTEVPLSQVGDNGELYYANMIDNTPIKRFPGGGKVNPDGVTNQIDQVNFFEWEETALSWIDKQSVGNMALFAVYGATTGYNGIYSYGRYNKNHPFVMNLDHQLDADELGAITSVDGTVLVSYRDGTEFGVKAVDPTTKATGVYEGLDLRGKRELPTIITNWKYAEIYCEPLPDGSSIEFQYKINKTGGWVTAYMQDGSNQFRGRDETKAVFFMNTDADIFEPRVIINPTGNVSPVVHRIKVYFD